MRCRYKLTFLCGALHAGGPMESFRPEGITKFQHRAVHNPSLLSELVMSINLNARRYTRHLADKPCGLRHALYCIQSYESDRVFWRPLHPSMDEIDRLEVDLRKLAGLEDPESNATRSELQQQIAEARRVILLDTATIQDAHARGIIPDITQAIATARFHNRAYRELALQLRDQQLPPA